MHTKVGIVKCLDYNTSNVTAAIKEILSYFGGAQNFVKKDSRILIKPNLLIAATPEKLVTTHPAVIEGIIVNLIESGINHENIHLGDSPGFGTVNGVAEACGIKKVCDKYRVKIVEFNRPKWVKVDISGYRKISIAEAAYSYNCIINAAKLKAHGQLLLTGAVKNMFGFCIGKIKTYMHLKSRNNTGNFSKMIVKNYSLINPAFSIVDAIFAMEGIGPTGGNPRNLGLIIAGRDAVAIDRVIAEILSIPQDNVPILKAAKELNIGESNLENIDVVGTKLDEIRITDFKLNFKLDEIGFDLFRFVKSHLKDLIAKIKELHR